MKDLGNITFDTLAGKTAKDFPVEKIEYHLQQLEQIRSLHKTYIDKRIAHYDKGKKIEELGTFQDLDNAVSSFKEIVSQYYLLLRAEDVKSFFRIPHPQGDWKLIFRQAWISDVTTMDENG